MSALRASLTPLHPFLSGAETFSSTLWQNYFLTAGFDLLMGLTKERSSYLAAVSPSYPTSMVSPPYITPMAWVSVSSS